MKLLTKVLYVSNMQDKHKRPIIAAIESTGFRVENMSVEAVRRDAQAVLAYGAIVLEETTPVDAGFALLAMLQKVGALPIYLGAPDVPQRVREPFEWGAVDFVYKDTDGF